MKKIDVKFNSGLIRFDGMAYIIMYCRGDKDR